VKTHKKTTIIKRWIKAMGFKLVKSHMINKKKLKINYYTLGNFGVYEFLHRPRPEGKLLNEKQRKFISWTPWGIDFKVNSVKDLSKAYQDSLNYNPDIILNG
jgi:hypothetical protein